MLKKIKKLVFGVGTLALMATVVAGCSESPKYINETEDRLTSNLKEVIKQNNALNLEKFEILAVDVEKSGFTFDVVFNGVAGFENNKKAYMNVSYEVAAETFSNLKKNSSRERLFEVFSNIVDTHEINDYSLAPVSGFEAINEALVKNTPAPFKDFKITEALTYHISAPEFNDETKQISFDIKNIAKLKQGKTELGFGLGIGFDASIGFGVGLFHSSKDATFVISDQYTIDASSLNYEDLKNNPEKVFDYFINAVNEKDGSLISAERLNVNDVTYQNANDLSIKLKDLDREMGQ